MTQEKRERQRRIQKLQSINSDEMSDLTLCSIDEDYPEVISRAPTSISNEDLDNKSNAHLKRHMFRRVSFCLKFFFLLSCQSISCPFILLTLLSSVGRQSAYGIKNWLVQRPTR
jgi:hypothetical protein